MKLTLRSDWRSHLHHAWSVRFIALAAILSGTAAILPYLHEYGFLEFLPGGLFVILVFIVTVAAFAASFIIQEK